MSTVVAVERRRRPISAADWSKLEANEEFWRLEERGVINVRHRGPGKVELEGTRYVGRAQLGDVLLQIEQKIDGALAALIGFATFDSFRVESVKSPASDLGALMRLLVAAFVQRTREYAGRGVDWRYGWKRESGSLVAGRLDIEGTIKLRALGHKHQAAFLRPIVDRNVEFNQVLLAALREVEKISALVGVAATDLARARGLSQYLADARTVEVLFGARAGWIARAQRLAESERQDDRRDLASLAAVLLGRQSFEFGAEDISRVPRAWFLNLETLFEEAARRRLRAALPTGLVSVQRSDHPKIFTDTGSFSAEPDIVMRRRSSGACLAIGDVKYKDWPGPSTEKLHGDVYQLLVHAAAFEAPAAFLLYPHESFEARHLGKSVTGCDTWIFAVDVRNLDPGMAMIAGALPALSLATVP